MSAQWIAIQSFQRSQDLISAVNTLSIHIKLRLAGIPDEERIGLAERAQETLASFFRKLERMVQEAEQEEGKPLMGAELRLRQLARNFIKAKRDRSRFQSVLFRDTLSHAKQLLCSDKEEDQRSLLQCLEELRIFLEEHMHADAMQILGKV